MFDAHRAISQPEIVARVERCLPGEVTHLATKFGQAEDFFVFLIQVFTEGEFQCWHRLRRLDVLIFGKLRLPTNSGICWIAVYQVD